MDPENSKSLKTVWLACWQYFDMYDVLAAPDPGIVYCFWLGLPIICQACQKIFKGSV